MNIFGFFQSLGGNIISRKSTSDLNPVLAAGNCILNLASRGKFQGACLHVSKSCSKSCKEENYNQ